MGFEPGSFRWPPLRLARLCREHVSVVVVSPLLLEWFTQSEEDEVRSAGRAIGMDVHRDFCEIAIAGDGEARSDLRRRPSRPSPRQAYCAARSLPQLRCPAEPPSPADSRRAPSAAGK